MFLVCILYALAHAQFAICAHLAGLGALDTHGRLLSVPRNLFMIAYSGVGFGILFSLGSTYWLFRTNPRDTWAFGPWIFHPDSLWIALEASGLTLGLALAYSIAKRSYKRELRRVAALTAV